MVLQVLGDQTLLLLCAGPAQPGARIKLRTFARLLSDHLGARCRLVFSAAHARENSVGPHKSVRPACVL